MFSLQNTLKFIACDANIIFNNSGAETGIFQENLVNAVATDYGAAYISRAPFY